jgi:hypothetical protein
MCIAFAAYLIASAGFAVWAAPKIARFFNI